MKPRTSAATHSINHGDTKGKQHSLEEKSQFGVSLWSYWIIFWVLWCTQVPLLELLVDSWQNNLSWLKEPPHSKDLSMLLALIAGTLILLMLLSANFTGCKNTQSSPFWALSSCPTFSLTLVLRLHFLKRTPYEERSVLHKSKQHSQIHSPRWGCRHQRAHMGRQYLTIQSSGAAFRQIDYDLLPAREEAQKRIQRQDTSSPAFSELGRIITRTERKIYKDYRSTAYRCEYWKGILLAYKNT